MPISPQPARRQPFFRKIPAVSIPVSMACFVSLRVMARSFKKFFVPYEIFRSSTPVPVISEAIPTSTGRTPAPVLAAIRQTQEIPFAIFFATMDVTSWPVCVTPSSTIPLSPHITAIHL